MPVNMAMNVIGMPAFVDYYTIHNPTNGIIGFVPTSQSLKTKLQKGSPSYGKWILKESTEPFWDFLALFLAFFVTAAAILFIVAIFVFDIVLEKEF